MFELIIFLSTFIGFGVIAYISNKSSINAKLNIFLFGLVVVLFSFIMFASFQI